jgi:uncharacterized protein (TIGR02246 family)
MRTSVSQGIGALILAAIILVAARESPPASKDEKRSDESTAAPVQNSAPGKRNARNSAPKNNGTQESAPEEGKRPSSEAQELSTDEEAIRRTAETFARAYAEGDAKAAAAHFTENAEYVDEYGYRLQGRDEIEQNFARFFADNKAAACEIEIDSIRFPDPAMAVEDGTSTILGRDGEPRGRSRYIAVHLKTGDQWLVAMVREQALRGERRHREELRQLEWLTGEWIDEADESIVTFTCRPVDDGNFLLREFRVTVAGDEVISGAQRISWDPLTGRLRAWTFDSQGGHFEGVWRRDGDTWVLNSTGVTADGETASGTSVFTIVNPHTITWQAVDHEIEGVRQPDSETYTLVRVEPAPEMREGHDKEARK